jgi:hypothetical protein
MSELILVLILLFPALFAAFSVRRFKRPASDRFYHQLLIQLIRKNGGRPITSHENIVNSHTQSYPQLLHVLIAWLPKQAETFLSNYMPVLVNLLLGAAVYFIFQIPDQFKSTFTFWGFEQRLFAELLFVLTPYHYNTSNAKNVGLSARGIGLLLGYLYALLTLVFEAQTHFSWMLAGSLVLLAFLILFASQFATQFLVFGTVLFSIFYRNPLLLFFPIAGYLVYLALFPSMAISTIRGQLGHKKLFYKHLSERLLLNYRPSIWRDLWNDIPRLMLHLFRTSKTKTEAFRKILTNRYIFTNPLIILLLELPLLVPALIGFALMGDFKNWAFLSISAALIFLATSFRKTRFLGEPERYVEMILPALIIWSVLSLPHEFLMGMLVYCAIRVLYALLRLAFETQAKSASFESELEHINQFIRQRQEAQVVRLLCNSTESTKYMLRADLPIFYYWVTATSNDEFHFLDVHATDYNFVTPEALPRIAKRYALNTLLIDHHGLKTDLSTIFSSGMIAETLIRTERFTLYSLAV